MNNLAWKKPERIPCSVALIALVLNLGCSRSDSMGGTIIPDGGGADGTAPTEWPTNDCIVIRKYPGTAYTRRSYDPGTRTISEIWSASPRFDDASSHWLYWVLDVEGHVLVEANVTSDPKQEDRIDFTYDERGNLTSSLYTRGAWSDLHQPPTSPPSMRESHANTYDAQGLLVESRFTSSNPADSPPSLSTTTSYQHDSLGRCQRRTLRGENVNSVEERGYVGDHLAETETTVTYLSPPPTSPDGGPSTNPVMRKVRYYYGDQGRLTLQEVDRASPGYGVPDGWTLWTYADDGSWTVDQVDLTSDAVTDQVEINGQLRWVNRRFETWSAACAAVEAQIPKVTSLACRVEH
jgi:hypothetical protein